MLSKTVSVREQNLTSVKFVLRREWGAFSQQIVWATLGPAAQAPFRMAAVSRELFALRKR